MEGIETFREHLNPLLRPNRYNSSLTKFVVLGDGAALDFGGWRALVFPDALPNPRLLPLSRNTSGRWPATPSPQDDDQQRFVGRDPARYPKQSQWCDVVQRRSAPPPTVGRLGTSIERLVSYLRHNQTAASDYQTYRQQGLMIGSGVVGKFKPADYHCAPQAIWHVLVESWGAEAVDEFTRLLPQQFQRDGKIFGENTLTIHDRP